MGKPLHLVQGSGCLHHSTKHNIHIDDLCINYIFLDASLNNYDCSEKGKPTNKDDCHHCTSNQ